MINEIMISSGTKIIKPNREQQKSNNLLFIYILFLIALYTYPTKQIKL